jgi:hypothetical protein
MKPFQQKMNLAIFENRFVNNVTLKFKMSKITFESERLTLFFDLNEKTLS